MQEEWKDVVGYEGVYKVSNFGNVRSVDRLEVSSRGAKRLRWGIVLKQKTTEQGYATVHLRDKANDKESWPPVHRLVATAFIENPEGKLTVNHKDGVKLNNHISNLEWATQQEQTQHAFDNDLMFVRGHTMYDLDFKQEVKDYYTETGISIKKLAKHFNMSSTTASRIVRGLYGDPRKTPKEVVAKAMWLREQGFSFAKIGEIVGVNLTTVHKWALPRGLVNIGIRAN